ncbi:hypothetical protein SAMN02927923_00120 [Microvirga guangxiensis]|uniref:Uncharacterized protein n=1 Tax=Microvirga guangxiensis TaxID=549386 RepID=A0A1G5B4I4_9HYPH|nr:hypothetical protein SAMN02927923_00120 [Microvirga guangxiensis]
MGDRGSQGRTTNGGHVRATPPVSGGWLQACPGFVRKDEGSAGRIRLRRPRRSARKVFGAGDPPGPGKLKASRARLLWVRPWLSGAIRDEPSETLYGACSTRGPGVYSSTGKAGGAWTQPARTSSAPLPPRSGPWGMRGARPAADQNRIQSPQPTPRARPSREPDPPTLTTRQDKSQEQSKNIASISARA